MVRSYRGDAGNIECKEYKLSDLLEGEDSHPWSSTWFPRLSALKLCCLQSLQFLVEACIWWLQGPVPMVHFPLFFFSYLTTRQYQMNVTATYRAQTQSRSEGDYQQIPYGSTVFRKVLAKAALELIPWNGTIDQKLDWLQLHAGFIAFFDTLVSSPTSPAHFRVTQAWITFPVASGTRTFPEAQPCWFAWVLREHLRYIAK